MMVLRTVAGEFFSGSVFRTEEKKVAIGVILQNIHQVRCKDCLPAAYCHALARSRLPEGLLYQEFHESKGTFRHYTFSS
jgi:hypothetical protein